MSWSALASLGLLVLKIALELLSRARERNAIDQGRQVEIARASLALLDLTEQGRAIRSRIESMPENESDKLWQDMLRP